MLLSVIIPAFNEAETIEQVIQEIIGVNDGSSRQFRFECIH